MSGAGEDGGQRDGAEGVCEGSPGAGSDGIPAARELEATDVTDDQIKLEATESQTEDTVTQTEILTLEATDVTVTQTETLMATENQSDDTDAQMKLEATDVTDTQTETPMLEATGVPNTQMKPEATESQTEALMKKLVNSSRVPETLETQRAGDATHLCSEMQYREEALGDLRLSLYSLMPDTRDTEFAREMTELQSEVRYRADGRKKLSSSLFSQLPDTMDTQHAKNMTDLQSHVTHTHHACSPVRCHVTGCTLTLLCVCLAE
ncbi:uncharacterized protein LOC120467858 isoform X1 [Pimephales promelas]|uniref:uncharacterized protein LOC120467858 isoform X1 n=1 Tax=Pimephales promelas TaxID=90988 RepID=UPI0019556C1E|nr:uncharacterized protein LOC120467858 isoform X1 [Pimephales promelas]XP_039512349.1 uncharacterized protein LOC120467858 isoform X1 [Pimephales promelas]